MFLTSRIARAGLLLLAVSLGAATAPGGLRAQDGEGPIREADARRWLTELSSDLMQGRRTFTEGYGLASSYVASELRRLGVEPLGEEGTYFQPVIRRGFIVAQQSRVTVVARGETRTFTHGEHVSFAADPGGRQTLTFRGVEFVGEGLGVAGDAEARTRAQGLAGKLALFLPDRPRASASAPVPRNLATPAGRAAALVRRPNVAAAAIGLRSAAAAGEGAGFGGRDNSGPGTRAPRPDITTTGSVDRLVAPAITADEAFFSFLFAGVEGGFAALRAKAERGETLPHFSLADVEVTIDVDARYDVVTAERTQNVVGLVRGADPALRDEYVMFGAHLDHLGYGTGQPPPDGRVNVALAEDSVWNGADDDGSGSTAVLAIAKAFATGAKPKRSAIFVWHAGEESGLIGSQHMADSPVVPLDRVQAMFNIDMIGRNRDDKADQANTVFIVGADRISTDLHNVIVDVNGRLARPLTLDYEYNDPADPNRFYTRSDHYSYAAKGVPSVFFFTGEHPDYHANTDTVDKILFPKLVRITEFIYRAGYTVADEPAPIVRDNRGPRSGRGFSGPLGR